MKTKIKIIILVTILVLILLSVVLGLKGSFTGNVIAGDICETYGSTASDGLSGYYCDFSGSYVMQKNSGECMNDFECVNGYSCLGDVCTNEFNSFLANLDMFLAANATENITSFCMGDNLFCLNSTAPLNSTSTNNSCSFKGEGYTCYRCSTGLYWNETLGKCITGMCSSDPGCLNLTSLENATHNNHYCSGSLNCFSCDSDYEWDSDLESCILKNCSFTPGCLDSSNLSNALQRNRYCSGNQKCYICISGYKWNISSDACEKMSSSSNNGVSEEDWSLVYFTSSDLDLGNEVVLAEYDKISFSFESLPYWIGILKIDSSKLNFMFGPVLGEKVVFKGSPGSYDLNMDGLNDIEVNYKGLSGNKAILSVKRISSATSTTTSGTQTPSTILNGSEEPNEDSSSLFLIILGVVILAVIIFLIAYLVKTNRSGNAATQTTTTFSRPPTSPPVNSSLQRPLS